MENCRDTRNNDSEGRQREDADCRYGGFCRFGIIDIKDPDDQRSSEKKQLSGMPRGVSDLI